MPQTDLHLASEAPRSQVRQVVLAAVGTAGNDLNTDVFRIGSDGTIDSVTYIPAATITGANTHTRKLVLVNLGAAGSGTTVVASLQFNSGVNATADVEKAITLSVVAGATAVAAGDVLQAQSTHVGNGIADPGGLLVITLGAT
jgi:hypothetical protein